ncbi:MAG: sulfurtransferase [Rhizobacter sp.]|nr:sulfurtransferase [Burkholderiales bacterium]
MVEQMDGATVAEARANELAKAVFLDVREPWEFDLARIENSVNIPMSTLVSRVEEVRALQQAADSTSIAPIVVICHHGVRSLQCANFLSKHGLDRLINLSGGIAAWSARVDPTVPQY